jgi:hypothetical protein
LICVQVAGKARNLHTKSCACEIKLIHPTLTNLMNFS